MKSIRTFLTLACVSAFASSAALAEAGTCPVTGAKGDKPAACCTASGKDAPKACCAEKSACCESGAKKEAKKGQTPSGK